MSNAVHAPRLAIALLAALALAACSKGDHASTDEAHSGASSSSAGLPAGHVMAGEQLAKAKGKATGQSCIDCHGADGNAPIDPTYPKLGGQNADCLYVALKSYTVEKNNYVGRSQPVMGAMAKQFNHAEMKEQANYIGSLNGGLQVVPESRFRTSSK